MTEPDGVRLRRLLVVEDDDHVASALVSVLGRQGYDVVWAPDGQRALAELDEHTDAVLLDLGLPDLDGFEVCRRIRQVSAVPLIMVTARTDLDSRVRGLQLGADDYVTKPYDLREVLARIEAVLRRGSARDGGTAEASRVYVDGLWVDLATRQVTDGDGSLIELTRKEFDVLALLVRQAGVVVPRERILFEVWGSDWKGLGRTLEVHVASMRAKLGDRDVVRTVRGVGYRIATSDGAGP
ncbi:response regulator transcription factor [Nocardioides limicola]|uniref:response regulator transcription factor n=1 Tax=Nocardioides limicola TaxID=2803368 RepID=UPI0027DD21A9|nr:response regulator transcription factor [Nocardioides sp. DJM-14]